MLSKRYRDSVPARTASWHAIVHFGSSGNCPSAPHGPYRSREEADEALSRFLRRLGADGGSYAAATSVRVVGPFPTRAVARDADISDYPRHIVREGGE